MTFDTVVFGSFTIGTGFTDGASISSGGLSLYIHILADVGSQPFDVTVIYMDQDGNPPEETLVSTSVPAYSAAGAYIQVSLNSGDSGVRDVTGASVVGGTAGDIFELTSLNEGLGKVYPIATQGQLERPWTDPDPKKEDSLLQRDFSSKAELGGAAVTGLVNSNTPPELDYQLDTEIVTCDCMANVNSFGFHADSCVITQNGDMIFAEVNPGITANPVDNNEPAARFKWYWDGDSYIDSGFFKVMFYYALKPGSMHIFEFLNKDLSVKFSTASSAGGWTRPSLYDYCGDDLLYPAGKAVDGNTSTEWRHSTSEQHWIVLDLGSQKGMDAVRIYTETGTDDVDIYVSDDPEVFTNRVIDTYPVQMPGWNKINMDFQTGRYLKIVFKRDPSSSLSGVQEIEVFTLIKQELSFVSTSWEARLRVKSPGTTAGDEFLKIYDVKIERYLLSGEAETLFVDEHPDLTRYGRIYFNPDLPEATGAKMQLAFSDNKVIWSEFAGPDGTINTFYDSPAYIKVPAGYTGYHFKWKLILESDGRYTPTHYGHTVFLWEKHPRRLIDLLTEVPGYFPPSLPSSIMPVQLLKACTRASDGYPAPTCAGGSFLTFDNNGNPEMPALTFIIHTACPRPAEGYPGPACPGGAFLVDDVRGDRAEVLARTFLLASSWLESVVGQVVSGYCRDQDENIIIGAVKVILTSSTTDGLDIMGDVNPETGLYQLFVKNVFYDGRDLIVTVEGKAYNMAYSKYGSPDIIDGTSTITSPLDLHFKKPARVCAKSVAHVDSLVSY